MCPLSAYCKLRSLVPVKDNDPAFTFSVAPKRCVTEYSFVSILRNILVRAGFDATCFTGHSFRRGGATFAFQSGVPGELINIQGDWKSEAYQRYLDFSLSAKLHVGMCMRNAILAHTV